MTVADRQDLIWHTSEQKGWRVGGVGGGRNEGSENR